MGTADILTGERRLVLLLAEGRRGPRPRQSRTIRPLARTPQIAGTECPTIPTAQPAFGPLRVTNAQECLGQIWDRSLGTGLGAKSRRISEPRLLTPFS